MKRKRKKKKEKLYKRVVKFLILASLFVMLIGIFAWYNLKLTDSEGYKITLKESAEKYFSSGKGKVLKETLEMAWNYYKAKGIMKLFEDIFYGDAEDRKALANSYKVIGLSEKCSQKELDQKCKVLARKWHPDRYVKDEVKRKEAELKFIEIQAACNMLSQERKSKSKKNKEETDL